MRAKTSGYISTKGSGEVFSNLGFCVGTGERVFIKINSEPTLKISVMKDKKEVLQLNTNKFEDYVELEEGCYTMKIRVSGEGWMDVEVVTR